MRVRRPLDGGIELILFQPTMSLMVSLISQGGPTELGFKPGHFAPSPTTPGLMYVVKFGPLERNKGV